MKSNTIDVAQLAQFIAWGYVLTATREFTNGIDRYRFEIAVRGKPIQPLLLNGGKENMNNSEVINTSELKKLMKAEGLSMSVLKSMEKNCFERSNHLRGTDTRTVCGQAYHLPCMQNVRLMMVTEFLALPESEQCGRCRNAIDPAYLPVMRMRRPQEPEPKTTTPKKVLPG